MALHKRSEYDDSEPQVRYRQPPEKLAWAPPTPWVVEPAWKRVPCADTLPSDVQAELDALKAKLSVTTTPAGRTVDPELERRYLEACAAKKAAKTQPGDEAEVADALPF